MDPFVDTKDTILSLISMFIFYFPQDYMMFDPFVNGIGELHDRHRDMRLDVDNMSYEVNMGWVYCH